MNPGVVPALNSFENGFQPSNLSPSTEAVAGPPPPPPSPGFEPTPLFRSRWAPAPSSAAAWAAAAKVGGLFLGDGDVAAALLLPDASFFVRRWPPSFFILSTAPMVNDSPAIIAVGGASLEGAGENGGGGDRGGCSCAPRGAGVGEHAGGGWLARGDGDGEKGKGKGPSPSLGAAGVPPPNPTNDAGGEPNANALAPAPAKGVPLDTSDAGEGADSTTDRNGSTWRTRGERANPPFPPFPTPPPRAPGSNPPQPGVGPGVDTEKGGEASGG